jgi:oligopeptide transport system substrate-binding protein
MNGIIFRATILSLTAFIGLSCNGRQAHGGDEMIVANGSEPTLDPSYITDISSTVAGMGLFEGLMQYDPTTNEPMLALAESYSFAADGDSVTFKLRRAEWSDGHPVTAGDFVYAMKRMLDPKTAAPYAYFPAMAIKNAAEYNAGRLKDFGLVGISAIDERTLRFELAGQSAAFLAMVCHSSFWPIPRWAVERYGVEWTKPGNMVSDGPYILAEWKPLEHILLIKNSRYWNASAVKLKRIRLTAGGDDAANYMAYKNGEIDWMRGADEGLIDEAQLRPDFQHAEQLATYYYIFNVKRRPFDRESVRQALALAIDKNSLAGKVLKGGRAATNAMVPSMPGYAVREGLSFNPGEARRLLADAGYGGGCGFPQLTLVYENRSDCKLIAEYVQQEWKKELGINTSLLNQETKTFIERVVEQHDFDVAALGWGGDFLDPSTMLDMFQTGSGNNQPQYSNRRYDAFLNKARTATGSTRMGILEEAEDLLLGEAPIVPIYHLANHNMIDLSKWGGWRATPLDYHPWQYIYRR